MLHRVARHACRLSSLGGMGIADAIVAAQLRLLSSSSGGGSSVTITQQVGPSKQERLAVTVAGGAATAAAAGLSSRATVHPRWSGAQLRISVQRQLAATFLPAGYPASVAPGYLCFVWWQALHHFAGSVNGVLASTFLLYSVGLGAGAIPTAGALNWVLKDGLGQLGTLLFGKAIAHSFDVNSRLWYLSASAKLNLAMGMEVCTLLAPQWFLPIGAAANAIKGLAWMSGGSSRSAFNVSFAVDNNIADVTAKATSQTICTSMAGTAAGAALAAHIGQSLPLAAAAFGAVAAVHMWTSWHSVRSVPLATLNPTRLQLLTQLHLRLEGQLQQPEGFSAAEQPWQQGPQRLRQFRESGQGPQPAAASKQQQCVPSKAGSLQGLGGRLPSPSQMALMEPILATKRWHAASGLPCLDIGASLLEWHCRSPALAAALLPIFLSQRHLLLPSLDPGGPIGLVYHEQASAEDLILGVLHAQLYAASMRSAAQHGPTPGERRGGGTCPPKESAAPAAGAGAGATDAAAAAAAAAAARSSLAAAQAALPGLLASLVGSGWDVGRVTLETTRRRASW